MIHLKERAECAESVRADVESRYSLASGDSEALKNQLVEQAQAAEFDVSKALGHADTLSQRLVILQTENQRLCEERDAAERKSHESIDQLRSLSDTLTLERRLHQERTLFWEEERVKIREIAEASTSNDLRLRTELQDMTQIRRRAEDLAVANAELREKIQQQQQQQQQKMLSEETNPSGGDVGQILRELHEVRRERNDLASAIKRISDEDGIDISVVTESESAERLRELAKQLFEEREARVAIESQAAEERRTWTLQLEDLQNGLEAQANALGTFTAKHQEAVEAAEEADKRARDANAQLTLRTQADKHVEQAMEKRVEVAEDRAEQLRRQLDELRSNKSALESDIQEQLYRATEETEELKEKLRDREISLREAQAQAQNVLENSTEVSKLPVF